MHHWKPAKSFLSDAVGAIREGRLVGMPTETVYGLAGNALDPSTLASIFEVKGRPVFDPLIVHSHSMEEAFSLARSVPPEARLLASRVWPGPLTLVLPRRPDLPDLLSAGLPTVALRVPAHPVARDLLRQCGLPLAAPSANRFGRISPTRAEHVLEEFKDEREVAGVLDAGPCEVGVESTVVGFPEPGRARVFRCGGLPLEEIREILGVEVEWVDVRDAVDDPELARRGEQSPGMLARHYAPATPLRLLEEHEPAPLVDGPAGWLCYQTAPAGLRGPVEVLSPRGSPAEAATRLFAALRALDGSGVREIIAWRVPNQGLGMAINDRLSRAAWG